MKKKIFITFYIIVSTVNMYCVSVDSQIELIKNTTNRAKRVELMNQLKRELILLNEKQRIQAINKLKSSMQHNHHNKNSNQQYRIKNFHQEINIEENINRVHYRQIKNQIHQVIENSHNINQHQSENIPIQNNRRNP